MRSKLELEHPTAAAYHRHRQERREDQEIVLEAGGDGIVDLSDPMAEFLQHRRCLQGHSRISGDELREIDCVDTAMRSRCCWPVSCPDGRQLRIAIDALGFTQETRRYRGTDRDTRPSATRWSGISGRLLVERRCDHASAPDRLSRCRRRDSDRTPLVVGVGDPQQHTQPTQADRQRELLDQERDQQQRVLCCDQPRRPLHPGRHDPDRVQRSRGKGRRSARPGADEANEDRVQAAQQHHADASRGERVAVRRDGAERGERHQRVDDAGWVEHQEVAIDDPAVDQGQRRPHVHAVVIVDHPVETSGEQHGDQADEERDQSESDELPQQRRLDGDGPCQGCHATRHPRPDREVARTASHVDVPSGARDAHARRCLQHWSCDTQRGAEADRFRLMIARQPRVQTRLRRVRSSINIEHSRGIRGAVPFVAVVRIPVLSSRGDRAGRGTVRAAISHLETKGRSHQPRPAREPDDPCPTGAGRR